MLSTLITARFLGKTNDLPCIRLAAQACRLLVQGGFATLAGRRAAVVNGANNSMTEDAAVYRQTERLLTLPTIVGKHYRTTAYRPAYHSGHRSTDRSSTLLDISSTRAFPSRVVWQWFNRRTRIIHLVAGTTMPLIGAGYVSKNIPRRCQRCLL